VTARILANESFLLLLLG